MQEPILVDRPKHWMMYFDGALNIDGASVGVLFITTSGDELHYDLRIHFPASNNTMEYDAALHGLHIVVSLDVKRLMVYDDSVLVINHINKDWSYTSEKMDAYCTKIRKLEGKFYGLEFHHVVHDENEVADWLSTIGLTRAWVLARVFVQDPRTSMIKQGQEVKEVPWLSS